MKITKEECVEKIEYFESLCNGKYKDEAEEMAADSLDISIDRLWEIMDEEDE